MSGILKDITKFVSNFMDVSAPYVLCFGLIVGVIAIGLIGIKLISAKNGNERAIVLENFKWSVIGLLLLGLFTSIVYFLIATFF
ncbi:hypothetical protein [Clostridium perfringens]|uniref:Uncharacterized protein n=2 Tax=Clostridium perfringens TaxID=1502 RepID=B1BR02_CLOPF|nr:hypothetical protein [Clostridium perfringens]EDT15825.1 hypothetical protein AC3_A0130 [Clostridium perfringens E str. JGS1987]